MSSKFGEKSFIKATYGSALIGSWLLLALYGFITSQTYTYFTSYPNDDIWKKSLVTLLWVLVTTHACVSLHALYHYLVENMFNRTALGQNVWSLNTSILIHVLAVMVVMLYFVLNIWHISPKRWRWAISGAILVPVLVHISFGLLTVSHMFRTSSLAEFHGFTNTAILPMTISQVIADVMTAVALCLLLRERKSPFTRTQSMLRTLMIYAVNRCILTSTLAVVEMLALIVDNDAMWYIGCEFLITDSYAISLLSTLNARKSFRGNNDGDTETSQMNSYQLSGIRFETETIVSGGSVGAGRILDLPPVSKDWKRTDDLEGATDRPFAMTK